MANRAAGKGYENEAFYENIKFHFLGVENIHVMRNSLSKVVESKSSYSNILNFAIHIFKLRVNMFLWIWYLILMNFSMWTKEPDNEQFSKWFGIQWLAEAYKINPGYISVHSFSFGRRNQCSSALFWWLGQDSSSLLNCLHVARSILQNDLRVSGK